MEERNSRKTKLYIIFSILFILILFLVKSVNEMTLDISQVGAKKTYTKVLDFKNKNQSIYFNTAIWGLTGDHYHIFLSQEIKNLPDTINDIIFNELELYYKIQGEDSLLIYVPSSTKKLLESFKIEDINIILYGFLYTETEKYKEKGLDKISVYDSFE